MTEAADQLEMLPDFMRALFQRSATGEAMLRPASDWYSAIGRTADEAEAEPAGASAPKPRRGSLDTPSTASCAAPDASAALARSSKKKMTSPARRAMPLRMSRSDGSGASDSAAEPGAGAGQRTAHGARLVVRVVQAHVVGERNSVRLRGPYCVAQLRSMVRLPARARLPVEPLTPGRAAGHGTP